MAPRHGALGRVRVSPWKSSGPSSPQSLHGHSQVWASVYPRSPEEVVCWGRMVSPAFGTPVQCAQHSLRFCHLALAWGLEYPLPGQASLGSSPVILPGPCGRDEMTKAHSPLTATSLGEPHPHCAFLTSDLCVPECWPGQAGTAWRGCLVRLERTDRAVISARARLLPCGDAGGPVNQDRNGLPLSIPGTRLRAYYSWGNRGTGTCATCIAQLISKTQLPATQARGSAVTG